MESHSSSWVLKIKGETLKLTKRKKKLLKIYKKMYNKNRTKLESKN